MRQLNREDRERAETRNAAIQELLSEHETQFPDPVDTLEDELAKDMGLRRHPAMSRNEWRATRVQYINAETPEDEES